MKRIKKDLLTNIIGDANDIIRRNYHEIPDGGVLRCGWHNFFENKVGVPGASLPLLYFREIGDVEPNSDRILNFINQVILSDSSGHTGWTILSVPNILTLEGSVLPLRALHNLGRYKFKDSVEKVLDWIIQVQNADGGWNSGTSNSDESRMQLTCNVIEVLLLIRNEKTMPALEQAVSWVASCQQADKGWGAVKQPPFSHVFFTARAVLCLAKYDYNKYKNEIVEGIEYIKRNISYDDTRRYHLETYDIHFAGGYNRITMEHDTMAAILNLVTFLPKYFSCSFVFAILENVISYYNKFGFVNQITKKKSIWTVIPLATSINYVINFTLPDTHSEWYLLFDSIKSDFDGHYINSCHFVFKWIFRNITKRMILFMSAFVLCAAIVGLFCGGIINLKDLILSIIIPVVLFILGLIPSHPRNN